MSQPNKSSKWKAVILNVWRSRDPCPMHLVVISIPEVGHPNCMDGSSTSGGYPMQPSEREKCERAGVEKGRQLFDGCHTFICPVAGRSSEEEKDSRLLHHLVRTSYGEYPCSHLK